MNSEKKIEKIIEEIKINTKNFFIINNANAIKIETMAFLEVVSIVIKPNKINKI